MLLRNLGHQISSSHLVGYKNHVEGFALPGSRPVRHPYKENTASAQVGKPDRQRAVESTYT